MPLRPPAHRHKEGITMEIRPALDEVLACREERSMLVAAGAEYGFSASEFAKKYREAAGRG